MRRYHRIYLASAGTGKTFRLSGRFLDLLLAGIEPGSILATTFTRKAAEEILERVLKRLVEMIDEVDARTELAGMRDFGQEFGSAQALDLLTALVRSLHRFEVRTLDSFFIHLARLFTLELGLPPQWSVAQGPEVGEVTAEALARLLEGVQGPQAEAQFAELLREITSSNGAGRAIYKTLTQLVEDGREVFLDSEPAAWDLVRGRQALDPDAAGRIAACIEGLVLPMTQGRDPTPKKHWQNAQKNLVEDLLREDWQALLNNGLFKKFLEGAEKFDRVVIDDSWLEALAELKEHAAVHMLATLSVRNARVYELFSRYESLLREVKRERGLYEFSDIPRALAPDVLGGTDPITGRGLDLAYRLDAHLHHLLLDEFQDTAPVQWRVLDRLAEEICSDGSGDTSFFCVGDIKQSIYGWRAAEPRLLESLGGYLNVDPEPLDKNYRSSEVILDTVDSVFSGIASLPVFDPAGKQVHKRAAARFEKDYQRHSAAKDLPGIAELRQAPPPQDGQDRGDPVIELAVQRVVAISKDQPSASIGVLVRSNKVIPPLIAKLQRNGILASGEGGNALTDSAAVLHFVSLLHLADHPSDSIAAFHLSSSPFPDALDCTDPVGDAAALSRTARERLSNQGLGQLCADLELGVRDHEGYSEWDRRRFRQLGDLAFSWSQRLGLRADLFVDHLRSHRVEDPAAAQIKVMTVHASKGLEFDVVVLPELTGALTKNRWQFLTLRQEPRGMFNAVTVNPNMTAAKLDQNLNSLFQHQSMRDVQESLCVLYVGMTRAKHRLEMLVPDPGNGDGGATPAGILRAALQGQDRDGDVIWRHPQSTDCWLPAPEAADELADAPKLSAGHGEQALSLAETVHLRRLPSRSPSAQEGGRCFRGAALLASTSNAGTNFGQLVHRFLEEFEWPGDTPVDESVLLALGSEIEPDEGRRRTALAYLQAALVAPEIRDALSPPTDGADGVTVWREREFCLAMPDQGVDAQWRGSFDRVVLTGTDGAFTKATIQDYKTDAVSADNLAEKVEYYGPQLQAYRRALALMTNLPEADIEAQLLFLKLGRVCTVPLKAD